MYMQYNHSKNVLFFLWYMVVLYINSLHSEKNMIQAHIIQNFCAIFYTFNVKYVAFRAPVLERL